MDAVGVARCQVCHALLNVAWSSCVACQSPVSRRERPVVPPARHSGIDWLAAWRELTALTYGIRGDDPRFQSVMNALTSCDDAYLANDWSAFNKQVRLLSKQ